jgi:4-diphosphocytidyl-2-C-methyl-D-erythritol kinase
MNKIQINSPAKINLFLKVKEKNHDGYHNIDTSFQLIDLFDNMSFETSDNGVVIKSNESFLENKNNTIYRSAKLLLKFIDGEMGVNIKIEKNIPVGAGLGGGSSNAASTLIALNKLWNLELSKDKLIKIAKKIGADVPFFVHGENAYGYGIGDKLKSRNTIKNKILLIYPEINNSSSEMYQLLDIYRKGSTNNFNHSQNDFWEIFFKKNDEIKKFYESTADNCQLNLSGSGSCMYVLYETESDIKEILKKIPRNWRFFFCKPLQYSPICYIK